MVSSVHNFLRLSMLIETIIEKHLPGAIPVARCTYHKSTFGPEHGPCKLKKWIVHRFPQPVSLSTPWGKSHVPQLPVDMTLVLYFQAPGAENALIR